MIKIIITSIAVCLSTLSVLAQTNKTFFLGHSLINFHIPNMVNKLSIAGTQNFSYEANIGIGAPLTWQWNNPTTGGGDQWDLTLPNGGYEHFIVTEAIPLDGHLEFSNTYGYTDSFYVFAQQNNPNIQYYIYETWHCASSGTADAPTLCSGDPNNTFSWRDRLDIDLPKWESIADSINANHTNPMLVIPGGQAFARLSDNIDAGNVPGLSSVFDLFEDEYHLDQRGNYFIACVMYAVIHGVSPVGLPNQLTTEFDVLYSDYPTTALAERMQEIAWETICDYQRDGVNCSDTSTTDTTVIETPNSINSIAESHFNVYPNPTKDILNIDLEANNEAEFSLLDMTGRLLTKKYLSSKKSSINLSQYNKGIYFIQLEINNKSYTRKIIIE